MLVVEVRLLHGVIRSTGSDDSAISGGESEGEWPPSPARIFSAFVAADGTRDACRVTDGTELRLLERAEPPVVYANERDSDVLTTWVRPRFVVGSGKASGHVQNYPGKSATMIFPGTRLCPRDNKIAYVWADIEPAESDLSALRKRAARIGYLGCSDSPVVVSVHTELSDDLPEATWTADPKGRDFVSVPFPGLVEALDNMYDRFSAGEMVRRAHFPTSIVRYRRPVVESARPEARSSVVWLSFDRPISGRRVLDVTETLRSAVMDLYQRHVAGPEGQLPGVLTGHGMEGKNFEHVHWLALPSVGGEFADGRIHGAAIMLPLDTPDEIVEGVNVAVWKLQSSELTGPKVFSTNVRRHAGEAKPWAANPRQWTRASCTWSSVFPVIHENFRRGGPTFEDVSKWCEYAGLPQPIAFRASATPFLRGAATLTPAEVRRRGDRHPYSHFEIVFANPLRGPLVLGKGRHFGLGLFMPTDRQDERA